MPTAYITKSNFNKISKRLVNVIKEDRAAMLDKLVRDFPIDGLIDSPKLNELLNNDEIAQMYAAKKLFEDFSGVITEIQNNQRSIKDIIQRQNRHFMQDVRMPAYHIDENCEAMHSGFFNITFPDTLSDAQSKQAKEWAKSQFDYLEITMHKNNPEILKSSFTRLNQNFKHTFGCQEDLKIIDLANSGSISFENSKVEDIVTNPYEALKEMYEKKYTQLRFYFDGEFAKKLKELTYMPHYKLEGHLKTVRDPKESNVIHEFHEVKQQLISVMTEAYQQKYSFDFSVESEILESLGFRQCQCCSDIRDSFAAA